LVGEALHVEHDEHLAYVGRDVRPDDPHHPARSTAPRLAREGAPGCRSTRDKEANWLPAPADRFILMQRMYWPKTTSPSILNGRWKDSAPEGTVVASASPSRADEVGRLLRKDSGLGDAPGRRVVGAKGEYPVVRPMSYGDAGTISPAVGTIRRYAGPPRASV